MPYRFEGDISTATFNLLGFFFISYINLFASRNFGIKCIPDPSNM